MSLVNDMLRDLDARDSKDVDLEVARPGGESVAGALEASERRGGRWLGVGAAALLLVSAAGGYWIFGAKAPRAVAEPSAENRVMDRRAESRLAVAATPAPLDAADLDEGKPVEAEPKKIASAADEPDKLRYAVDQILIAAEQALAEDRLTHPPVNNAYAYFRHALLLDPHNPAALAGIERVRRRYETLAQQAIAAGDLDEARLYVERVQALGLPLENLVQLNADLAAAVEERQTQELPSAPPEVELGASQEMQQAAAEEESRASIAPSWRSRQTRVLAEAGRHLERGDHYAAADVLQEFVAQYPNAQGAALMLFDAHLNTSNFDGARALLGTTEPGALRQYFYAKLAMQEGNNEAAGRLLEQAEPDEQIRQAYWALQGALYQRNGQYERAVGIYRRLVDMDNRQANYWLGLGVAAEAAQQYGQALQAFVAADQLPSINPSVSQYIKQRIQALSQ